MEAVVHDDGRRLLGVLLLPNQPVQIGVNFLGGVPRRFLCGLRRGGGIDLSDGFHAVVVPGVGLAGGMVLVVHAMFLLRVFCGYGRVCPVLDIKSQHIKVKWADW